MTGLLRKDLYLAWKTCKAYFVIAAVFLLVSFSSNGNLFYVVYPCVLAGMIPLTLMSYDERSHWLAFADTLPVSRTQVVSAKYLIGLIAQVLILTLIGVLQAIRLAMDGSGEWQDLVLMLSTISAVSFLAPAIYLPFMFKWGVEKTRIFYYAIVGFYVAVVAVVNVLGSSNEVIPFSDKYLWIACPVGIVFYALSWLLSIAAYEKREIP